MRSVASLRSVLSAAGAARRFPLNNLVRGAVIGRRGLCTLGVSRVAPIARRAGALPRWPAARNAQPRRAFGSLGSRPAVAHALPSLFGSSVSDGDEGGKASSLLDGSESGSGDVWTPLAASVLEGVEPGWSPPWLLQQLVDWSHMSMGLSWAGAIVAATLVMRSITLPFMIKQQQHSNRLALAQPEMKDMNETLSRLRETGKLDAESRNRHAQAVKEVFKKHNTGPLKAFIGPLLQIPLFISFFLAMRTLPERFSGLDSGGWYWFTDLSLPDPTYTLPVVSTAIMLLTTELGMRDQKRRMIQHPTKVQSLVQQAMRGLSLLALPVGCILPASVTLYWITNYVFTLTSQVAFRTNAFRKLCNVPTYEEIDAEQRKFPHQIELPEARERLLGADANKAMPFGGQPAAPRQQQAAASETVVPDEVYTQRPSSNKKGKRRRKRGGNNKRR